MLSLSMSAFRGKADIRWSDSYWHFCDVGSSRWAFWFTLRNTSTLRESFTEWSKNVRHLPRYLSIQRHPKFFSAYHL